MGLGFIIGGFCPGTSICALAIGKLDALAFAAGIFLGVFAFIEAFPLLENMYLANNLGQIRISEYLGISDILFGTILAAVAVSAFVGTWIIENRVNKRKADLEPVMRKRYIRAAISLFVVLGIVAFVPGKKDIIQMRITNAQRQQTCVFKEIPADKLANNIVNNFYSLNIIDVRSPEEYEAWHIPMAINIPFEELLERQNMQIFKQKIRTNIFYADNDTLVKMACLKAKFAGKSDNMILQESAQEFRNMFFEPEEPIPFADKNQISLYNFRIEAARQMTEMENAMKKRMAPVKREVITVRGGC
jgi:rhodanese-related sulfurtransferase